MYILGLSCDCHDSAAALLKDGELVCASQEERFTRIKHDSSYPGHAIEFCLERAGICANELDWVVFYEEPVLKFKRAIKDTLSKSLNISKDKILFCGHHLSHGASAFFCSPFSEAAIFICDGVGESTTTLLGRAMADWDGRGKNEIKFFSQTRFPHSLGLLYSAFTDFLGFEINEGEYKVMGMAAFGEPKYVDKIYRLINVNSEGSFRLNMKYFSFQHGAKKSFNKKFEDLFGPPRDRRARFVTLKTSFSDDSNMASEEELKANQYYADIAASIQKVIGDILVNIANHLYKRTKMKKLCLSGTVALNCMANWRILNETPFDEIFVQPASGDSGGAIGAAFYIYHSYLEERRKFVLNHAFLGKDYIDPEIKSFLDENNLTYLYFDDEDKLLGAVLDALMSQKVVGWFQGRAEWGPRALGNRSILADPRSEKMKDIVNLTIKFREPFRPFAPSVLSERADEFFALGKSLNHYPLKFMLYAIPAKGKEKIPAVANVDGSSRIHAVDKETNPLYYRLIEKFFQATGIPILLNTSFNLQGEPIVNSPYDAFETFSKSQMDMLIMGHFVLVKK